MEDWDEAREIRWATVAYWKSDEAAEILAGFEPGTIEHRHGDARFVELRATQKLIERDIEIGLLLGRPDRIDPVEFAGWCLNRNVSLPGHLLFRIVERSEKEKLAGPKHAQATAANSNDPTLHARSLKTLLKLVVGMAIAKYQYKVGSRNSAASNISRSLQLNGLDVSDDTVRFWLDHAKRELDLPDTKAG